MMRNKKTRRLLCTLALVFLCCFVGEVKANTAADEALVRGHSLSLGELISVNFYVELSDTYKENKDATAEIVFGDKVKETIKIADFVSENSTTAILVDAKSYDCYEFSYAVPAKRMAEDITLTFKQGDTVVNSDSYCVNDYLDAVLKKKETQRSSVANVVSAMSDYGKAAQLYFGHNSGSLSVAPVIDESELATFLGDFALKGRVTDKQLMLIGTKLFLESDTTLRLYLDVQEDVTITSDYSILIYEGDNLVSTKGLQEIYVDGRDCYYVDIDGLKAQDLDTSYTIKYKTYNTDEETQIVEGVSALTYARNMIVKYQDTNNKTNLVNLSKCLYLYNKLAETYATDATGNFGGICDLWYGTPNGGATGFYADPNLTVAVYKDDLGDLTTIQPDGGEALTSFADFSDVRTGTCSVWMKEAYTLSNEESISGAYILRRYKDNNGNLLKLTDGISATISATIDGSYAGAGEESYAAYFYKDGVRTKDDVSGISVTPALNTYDGSLIYVAEGATLNITEGTYLGNNYVSDTEGVPAGGDCLYNAGSVNMTGGTIEGEAYQGGTFTVSGDSTINSSPITGKGLTISSSKTITMGSLTAKAKLRINGEGEVASEASEDSLAYIALDDAAYDAESDAYVGDQKDGVGVHHLDGSLYIGKKACVCGYSEDNSWGKSDGQGACAEGHTEHIWLPCDETTNEGKLPQTTGYYYLTTNMTTTSVSTVNNKQTVCLDLNGHTLKNTSNQRLLNIQVGGASNTKLFRITDLSATKDGEISLVGDGTQSDYGLITVWMTDDFASTSSGLELYAGTIDTTNSLTKDGADAFIRLTRGDFTMYGGKITGTSSGESRKVQLYNTSTFTMHNDAVLEGGRNSNRGGGNVILESADSVLNLYDNVVIQNGVSSIGGGNVCVLGGTVNVSGGTIADGKFSADGEPTGGSANVYVNAAVSNNVVANTSVTVSDCTIEGIGVNSATAAINVGSNVKLTAPEDGSGLVVTGNYTGEWVTLSDGFSENEIHLSVSSDVASVKKINSTQVSLADRANYEKQFVLDLAGENTSNLVGNFMFQQDGVKLAVDAHGHIHCPCGGSDTRENATCDHWEVAYTTTTSWGSNIGGKTLENYYLSEDLTLNGVQNLVGDKDGDATDTKLNICLNGKTMTGKTDERLIQLYGDLNLSLCGECESDAYKCNDGSLKAVKTSGDTQAGGVLACRKYGDGTLYTGVARLYNVHLDASNYVTNAFPVFHMVDSSEVGKLYLYNSSYSNGKKSDGTILTSAINTTAVFDNTTANILDGETYAGLTNRANGLSVHDWDSNGTVTTKISSTKPGVKTYNCLTEGCSGTKTENFYPEDGRFLNAYVNASQKHYFAGKPASTAPDMDGYINEGEYGWKLTHDFSGYTFNNGWVATDTKDGYVTGAAAGKNYSDVSLYMSYDEYFIYMAAKITATSKQESGRVAFILGMSDNVDEALKVECTIDGACSPEVYNTVTGFAGKASAAACVLSNCVESYDDGKTVMYEVKLSRNNLAAFGGVTEFDKLYYKSEIGFYDGTTADGVFYHQAHQKGDGTPIGEYKAFHTRIPHVMFLGSNEDFEDYLTHTGSTEMGSFYAECAEHSYRWVIAKESGDDVAHKQVCTVCGQENEAKTHTWNTEGEELKAAGYGTKGLMMYECNTCDVTKTVETDSLQPTYTNATQYTMMSHNILQAYIKENALGWKDILPTERYGKLYSTYSTYKPDIIAFQECDEYWHDLIDGLVNSDSTSDRTNLNALSTLGYKDATAGFTSHSIRAIRNPIYYNTEKLEVVDAGYRTYAGYTNGAEESKVTPWCFTWAVFKSKGEGTADYFAVTSTHLISNIGEDLYKRTNQVKELMNFKEELEDLWKVPVIMMGDYNTTSDSEPYVAFEEGTKVLSARNSATDKTNMLYQTAHTFGQKPVQLEEGTTEGIIDHCMYSTTGVSADKYEVLVDEDIYSYSDHTPHRFTFKIKGLGN